MTAAQETEERLLDALHDVEDPELPVSIVDLGLIVGLNHLDGRVDLQITFTSMGCPGMEMIIDDARDRLLKEPDVREVNIEVVWHPIWTKDRLSDDGKMQLREWGLSL